MEWLESKRVDWMYLADLFTITYEGMKKELRGRGKSNERKQRHKRTEEAERERGATRCFVPFCQLAWLWVSGSVIPTAWMRHPTQFSFFSFHFLISKTLISHSWCYFIDSLSVFHFWDGWWWLFPNDCVHCTCQNRWERERIHNKQRVAHHSSNSFRVSVMRCVIFEV